MFLCFINALHEAMPTETVAILYFCQEIIDV
jgi:hypothetical protein